MSNPSRLPPLPRPLTLARRPTPIERASRLSAPLGGTVWVKRDDLTGVALSGNKVRKLEYSLAEGLRRGATAVMTTGGVQSNHCRATAVAARRLGLEPFLVLRTPDGQPPEELDGNYFLDRLLGATIRLITPAEYADRDALMAQWARELERDGRQVWVVPEGASDAFGALGYVKAAEEIVAQINGGALPGGESDLAAIVHACGSGGTAAGLAAGLRALEVDVPVIAYAVCDDEATFRTRIDAILGEMAGRFGLPGPADVHYQVVADYRGIGYALSTPEELTFIRDVARLEGLLLDPVYTGKALRGLVEDLRAGRRFPGDGKVLFIHTGGVFGLFPKRSQIPGC